MNEVRENVGISSDDLLLSYDKQRFDINFVADRLLIYVKQMEGDIIVNLSLGPYTFMVDKNSSLRDIIEQYEMQLKTLSSQDEIVSNQTQITKLDIILTEMDLLSPLSICNGLIRMIEVVERDGFHLNFDDVEKQFKAFKYNTRSDEIDDIILEGYLLAEKFGGPDDVVKLYVLLFFAFQNDLERLKKLKTRIQRWIETFAQIDVDIDQLVERYLESCPLLEVKQALSEYLKSVSEDDILRMNDKFPSSYNSLMNYLRRNNLLLYTSIHLKCSLGAAKYLKANLDCVQKYPVGDFIRSDDYGKWYRLTYKEPAYSEAEEVSGEIECYRTTYVLDFKPWSV